MVLALENAEQLGQPISTLKRLREVVGFWFEMFDGRFEISVVPQLEMLSEALSIYHDTICDCEVLLVWRGGSW